MSTNFMYLEDSQICVNLHHVKQIRQCSETDISIEYVTYDVECWGHEINEISFLKEKCPRDFEKLKRFLLSCP